MDPRDLGRTLERWREAGLVSAEQAQAIAEYEAAEAGVGAPASRAGIDAGVALSYGGALVALAAVLGLYLTVLDDFGDGARVGLSWAIAGAAFALAATASRVRGGGAMADALGLATVILLAWAVGASFDVAGWIDRTRSPGQVGYLRELHEMRTAFMAIGLVTALAGWGLARTLPSSLAAGASAAGAVWAAAVLGWWLGDADNDAPGVAGGQSAVLVGFALVAIALLTARLRLTPRAVDWWIFGALAATNVAAVLLAGNEGGFFEGALLVYAAGAGIAAVITRRRLLLLFAAVTLYEYVGFVVFRTFDGAVAAIVVLALIGLGTALGGALAQRGGYERLLGRRW
jgi:hypothetical protein